MTGAAQLVQFHGLRKLTVKADDCELTVEGASPEAEHEGPQFVNLRVLTPIILRDFAPLDVTHFSLARPIHQQSKCVSIPVQGVSVVPLGQNVSHSAFVRIGSTQRRASGWDDALMRRVEGNCIRPGYYRRISLCLLTIIFACPSISLLPIFPCTIYQIAQHVRHNSLGLCPHSLTFNSCIMRPYR